MRLPVCPGEGIFGPGERVADPGVSLTFSMGREPGLGPQGLRAALAVPKMSRVWVVIKAQSGQPYKHWQACVALCAEALQPPARCTLLLWLCIESCPVLSLHSPLLCLTPLPSSLANAVG